MTQNLAIHIEANHFYIVRGVPVLANVDVHHFCCLIYNLQTLDLGKIYNITLKLAKSKIIQLVSGEYCCTDCEYTSKSRHNLPKHIEARHVARHKQGLGFNDTFLYFILFF